MTSDTLLPFELPAVLGKKLTVDFDAISQSSDAGLQQLREAERCLRIAGHQAGNSSSEWSSDGGGRSEG